MSIIRPFRLITAITTIPKASAKPHPALSGYQSTMSTSSTSQRTTPRNFILDFDGTITTTDTISTLARFGLAHQKSHGKDLSAAWDDIVARYGEDYSSHIKIYKPDVTQRKDLASEIAHLRSLRNIELRSFERVSKSGIFKGISREDWKEAGRKSVRDGDVVVRAGFNAFLVKVRENGRKCGIVSVNFSKSFILGVVEESAREIDLRSMAILANEPDEDGILRGPVVQTGVKAGPVMATSDRKLAVMKNLLSSWSVEGDVYIGDSGTDVECLMAENMTGIVIAREGKSSLMETLQRVNVTVDHLHSYDEFIQPALYWASDFEDMLTSPIFNKHSMKLR